MNNGSITPAHQFRHNELSCLAPSPVLNTIFSVNITILLITPGMENKLHAKIYDRRITSFSDLVLLRQV